MSWLVEGNVLVYVILGLVAAVCLYLWWQYRDRLLLIVAVVLLGALGFYFLLDLVVETDGEQMVRKVKLMARAVAARDVNGIAEHLANEFAADNVYGFYNKKSAQARVDFLMKNDQLTGAEVWDFERTVEPNVEALIELRLPREQAETLVRDHRVRLLHFKGKVKGPLMGDAAFAAVIAVFVREPDGQWRMRTFQANNPVTAN
jgi:hypothetical protein